MINFCTYNAKGLASFEKRKDVLNWLSSGKYDVIFLQETHLSKKHEDEWRMQWRGKCLFTTFSSNARGVAILFRNNLDIEIQNSIIDSEGRYIFIESKIEGKPLLLGNIYGPNEDNPDFFDHLKKVIDKLDTGSIILGGDWNTYLDFKLDTYNHVQDKNQKARQKILELKQLLQLEDVFRIRNPQEKSFTWSSKTPVRMSRLDYYLCSTDILNQTEQCLIKHGYRSDHSLVTLGVSFSTNQRGRGYWKFNSSLLHDKMYVDGVKRILSETVEQYYTGRDGTNPTFSINHRMLWEMIKLGIRGFSIKYSSEKKRERADEEKIISLNIDMLESKSDNDSIEQKSHLLSRLQEIRKQKMAGVLLRSRARWIEEGEINSRYFCSLEKRNFVRKTVQKLVENDCSYSDNDNILRVMKNFYEDLYSQKTNTNGLDDIIQAKFLPKQDVALSEEEKNFCDNDISKNECLLALRAMKNDKSPGLDGFSVEFYKFFWNDISEYLFKAYTEALQQGELSITQKEGLITCTPKPGKDLSSIKNWRPITLLNIDYKILSSAIANRFKKVLPTIISDTQKGFLKNRFIGENTRLLYDLLLETEKQQIPGLLLLVDFKKAFDSLSWSFIHKVLEHYKFGKNMQHWIKTLYTNISSRIINNGHISDSFKLQRGVRQGDPLSPYLFIMAVEPLATAIKNNRNIKGIQIDNVNSLIAQYADDIALTLDGTEKSLKNSLLTLRDFGRISGLEINYDKTKAIWFGSKINCKMKICTDWDLDWSNENFKFLGIIFDLNTKNIPILNYEKAIIDIEKMFKKWEYRNLTLFGKITIIKTFALSKINHILSIVPEPETLVKRLQKLFYNFLWNGKRNSIKHATLILDYHEGGIKMVDLQSFTKSVRLTWVKRLMTTNGQWQNLAKVILHGFSKHFFLLDNQSIKSLRKEIENPFWAQILSDWISLKNEPSRLFLWNNVNLKINKKKVIYKSYFENNVWFAEDFLNEENQIYTFQEFSTKYPQIKTNFIQYNGLISAIKKSWELRNIRNRPKTASLIDNILNSKKPSKVVYRHLIKQLGCAAETAKDKWERELSTTFDWEKIYNLPIKTTKDTKLKLLQYKISHRRVATNQFLQKIHIKDNSYCTFCNSEVETISHLFYHCRHSKIVLSYLKSKVNQASMTQIPDNEATILLGHGIENLALSYLLLCYKYFIYKCKYQEKIPIVNEFKNFLNDKLKIEKQGYILANKPQSFTKKWEHFDLNLLIT